MPPPRIVDNTLLTMAARNAGSTDMNATDMVDREAERLHALHKLGLLDTAPSEQFDRITRMAAQVFGLPIAAVSLTDSDRQWFKSRVGIDHWSIPRIKAPCATVAGSQDLLVVEDLLEDTFFKESHLALSGIRFYAGAPLVTSEGHCLGAMCVLGLQARAISEREKAALQDLAAMVMAQIELQRAISRVDPLSGLPNRKQFIEDYDDLNLDRPAGERRLAILVDIATPTQMSNAVRVMGSACLDDLMAETLDAYRAHMGAGHTLYQLAATQFIAITPPTEGADSWCGALQGWLDTRAQWTSSPFVTTPAIGIAPFTLGRDLCQDVLRFAQNAMQDAQQSGQQIGLYSPVQDAAYRRRFTLLNEFGQALSAPDQLSLVYQPKVDLDSGRCVGAEALLRWRHPELGDVAPGEFIPLVEQTSMMCAATLWVLEQAVRQLAAWQGVGMQIPIAVNVSVSNLLEAGFADQVVALLHQHGVAPAWLELEVTESAIMSKQSIALRTLHALHRAGIKLAIDDFGTGYSSLSYLQSIPAQVVKIDQSFVRKLGQGERDRTLVKTMISLSHELGFRVVAEGIETDAARQELQALGCDQGQGYWFARPLTPDDLALWYAAS